LILHMPQFYAAPGKISALHSDDLIFMVASSANETFQRALGAFRAGKIAEAEHEFKKLLAAHPRHVGGLNLFSILLTQLKRFEEAEEYVRRALGENARSDVTFYNYGIILKALDRPAEAVEQFSQALQLNAGVAETWNNRGTVLSDLRRYREAIADFDKAISINPNYPDAYCNKGKSLTELKRHDDAFAAYDKALALKPDLAEAWLGRGNLLFDLKRNDEALATFDKAMALKPDLPAAWLGLGNSFAELKRYDEAFAAYDKALTLKPDSAKAWLGRGNIFNQRKRYDDALIAYDKALALKSDLTDAWLGRGNSFADLRRYDEAFAAYDKALSIKPDSAEAWLGRGHIFTSLKRYDDASAAYDRALALKQDLAEAWLGRGNIFVELKRCDDAFAAYDRALALKPDLAEAWLGRGNNFLELKRYDDAFAAYDRALALKPDLAEAWLGRGNIFLELKRYDDAFVAYDRALTLKATLKCTEGDRLYTKLMACNWTGLGAEISHLLSAIREGRISSRPFSLLSIHSSPADQLKCAEGFIADQPSFAKIWHGDIYSHDRIRIAYLSADFRDHAMGYLMAGLFEQHDESRFEITGISFGADRDSDIRRRIKRSFEHFEDVRLQGDQEIAELIRHLEIDIAVDLMGFTQDCRPNIFARRPAPIQVNYLGYPGTMGADYFDYILADSTVIPEDQFESYSENVVWLPDTYQVNDALRPISERTPTRRECHLPEAAFVFCCFNNTYKITPDVFDIWMRLLKANDDSVLWLIEGNSTATANLKQEATRHGVSPERLIFAPQIPLADHLARHRQADLFLDTLPYNAHTTASDALWAGLPVLTCLGSAFAGRVAASLLKAVGLADLITTSLEDYEALALKLNKERALAASLKDKLARNRGTYPLFNTQRFTRHIETAYITMRERQQIGMMPKHFSVDPID
jgi:protein O-GlcNAc transferase